MPGINAIGIVGTDGITPVYLPAERWTVWSTHEIYNGGVGLNKYIPKVNDHVVEPETGITHVVVNLDNITYIPELALQSIPAPINTLGLISSTNDNYRIYYDKSTATHTLCVDSFMRIYNDAAISARIYKGTLIDDTKIISRYYDNSGNFIGHDIPLKKVAFNTHDNYAIKSIPVCNTTTSMVNGDVCTVVVFGTGGKVLSKVNCIIEETTYISQAFAEQKYITQIFIKSAFISQTNQSEINYPVNLPLQSYSPTGVVQYNDGSQTEYPIDGVKFSLLGLTYFLNTTIGHRVPLVLTYKMSPGEAALATVDNTNGVITKPYTLITTTSTPSYGVKLYVYPVWSTVNNNYSYNAFLLNLDRNTLFDVTSKVGILSGSPAFNDKAYGITQRITFTINLANVSNIFSDHIYNQTVDITLIAPPSSQSVNIWETVTKTPSTTVYGTNLKAVKSPAINTSVRIDNDILTVQEFITKLYSNTLPLFNPVIETQPLNPTHIEVKYGAESIIVPITQYNQIFNFVNVVTLYSNIYIVFLKTFGVGYLTLSVSSLTVR